MQSFRPTIWRLALFAAVFTIIYFAWNLYQTVTDTSLCTLILPDPGLAQTTHPYGMVLHTAATPSDVLRDLPAALTHNYNHCMPLSRSMETALAIVRYASIILIAILAYGIACGLSYIPRLWRRRPSPIR